ncbi:alpha-2,3-sialyltransferase, partial [Campylobacter jejuni]|nr:alpha-2,3-sialyltransferase [Campylobacter jejuni]
MKKIVLLGASNSRMPGGLQAGLSSNNVNFINLSLGGTGSLYGIYAINKYYDILKDADVIILENHMIDNILVVDFNVEINVILRDIFWLYECIAKLKKTILILYLPETRSIKSSYNKIKHIALYLCNQYGFNFIDIQKYMESKKILNFYLSYPNCNHQIATIMYNLGLNIIKNINLFKISKGYFKYNIPNFSIWHPNTSSQKINRDLIYKEKICIIDKEKEYFPSRYFGYFLLGIHTWTNEYFSNLKKKKIEKNLWNIFSYSSLKIQNNSQCIVKCFWTYNAFTNIFQNKFLIDSDTYFCFNSEGLAWSDKAMHLQKIDNLNNTLNYVGVSAFLLADQNGKFDFSEEIKLIQNENITIDKEYDFTYLVPPVEDYKTAIEEYNFRMDPVKLVPLQKQIKEKDNIISTLNQEKTTLQNELNSFPIKKQRLELANLEQDLIIKKLESKKLAKSLGIKMSIINPKITFIQANSAKARIQNHLSYKLGQALIANSKSILGYIRIPYVLSYIKDKHKFEQKAYEEKIKENPNLALPPLETYPDYNEALKEKECFTYKLGEALMQ